ncbi:hypothetical protein [Acidipila sp. EB88]|uniref:hypothetical protein n=1 Tax=Acidipila sp. EB88 TaxID=2305226 RepID=UPI000F5D5847|nr:hypothetical protein [Acidipila sp. EB88]RRA49541.1 hypothetical protein D1Y84_15935 [Acidipila sp. EB88]
MQRVVVGVADEDVLVDAADALVGAEIGGGDGADVEARIEVVGGRGSLSRREAALLVRGAGRLDLVLISVDAEMAAQGAGIADLEDGVGKELALDDEAEVLDLRGAEVVVDFNQCLR